MNRKKIALTAILILFWSVFIMAQSKPFIGYGTVEWGSNVQKVRQIYSIAESIAVEVADGDPTIVSITQNNVSDSIASRQFFFNKWNSRDYQLYRVIVIYDRKMKDWGPLMRVLEKTYGGETKSYPDGRIYGKFSPDIEVELEAYEYWGYGALIPGNEYHVVYTWKKYRDSYQAYKAEQERQAERIRRAAEEAKVQL